MPGTHHCSTLLAAGALTGLILATPRPAGAAGFYLQEQSVKGLGRAYSGEAADTGPESLWWNPAAIGDVEGLEVYSGLNGIFSDSSVTDRGSTIQRPGQPTAPVGGDPRASNPLEPGVVPNFDVAWRLNDHVALGLAVSAPFDFITKYQPTNFARYDAATSKLLDLDVQPTLALHLNRYLDLGVGFDAQYAKSTLSAALPNLSPLLPDGYNELRGNGWNYGYTVGAQLHPTDRLSLGASYRSAIDHTLNGTSTVAGLLGPLAAENGILPSQARLSTPWIFVFGGRYRLNDHWTVEGQMQRVGWSEFNAITVQNVAGTTVIPQGYHDTTTGAVGVDYTINQRWTLRGGVAYDPTPTPDIGRSARVPDGNRWLSSLGSTMRPSPRVELDAAVAYIHLQNSPIISNATAYAGTPVVTPIAYVAEAAGNAVIVSAGVKFKF